MSIAACRGFWPISQRLIFLKRVMLSPWCLAVRYTAMASVIHSIGRIMYEPANPLNVLGTTRFSSMYIVAIKGSIIYHMVLPSGLMRQQI